MSVGHKSHVDTNTANPDLSVLVHEAEMQFPSHEAFAQRGTSVHSTEGSF
jgi:hypothetical protein